MASVIVLTGPSQCGKSTIIDMFLKSQSEDFNPILIPKYITRPKRDNDGSDVIAGGVPSSCDLVYEQYGERYGLHFDTLYDALMENKCPIVIINDIKVLQDVKTALGSQALLVYMYRNPPVLQKFINEERARFTSGTINEEKIIKTATTRFNKANTIYRIYIENIYLFDKVILNVDSLENSKRQINRIVEQIITPKKLLRGEK